MNSESGPGALDPTARIPRVLFLVVFAAGMSFSLVGALLPDIAREFQLTNNQAATIPLVLFLGDFSGLILLGLFLPRARILLPGALSLLFLTCLALSQLREPTAALIIFYAFGLSRSSLIALPGIIVSRLTLGRAARSMNLIYAFFSAGVMLAPAGSGLLIASGLNYSEAFLTLAVLAGGAGFLAAMFPPPRVDLGQGITGRSLRELMVNHRRLFLAAVVMNICYVGAENVPNSWLPKFLVSEFPDYSEFRSSLVLSLFWAAITLGRFAVAAAIKQGASPRLMLASLAGLSALCVFMASTTNSPSATEAFFIASGFFFSGMFPLIISTTEKLPAGAGGAMFIMVMAAGSLGAAGAGKATGWLADAASFRAGMMVAAGLSAAVLLLTPLMKEKKAD